MKIKTKPSFHKDFKKTPKKVQLMAEKVYDQMINANDLKSLTGVKKRQGDKYHYKYQIGDYRIGFCIENDSIVELRLMNRDSIYLVFP